MSCLSNEIEEFLLKLFGEERSVLISRNELAQFFNCAPSQINYVLATRFSLDKGFSTDSRRGGGGYVTMVRLSEGDGYISELVKSSIGDKMTFMRVCQILERLCGDDVVSKRECEILKNVLSDKAIFSYDKQSKEMIRANMFKSFLTLLMRDDFDEENLWKA